MKQKPSVHLLAVLIVTIFGTVATTDVSSKETLKQWMDRTTANSHKHFHIIWCSKKKIRNRNNRRMFMYCDSPLYDGANFEVANKYMVFNACGVYDTNGTGAGMEYRLINFKGKCVTVAKGEIAYFGIGRRIKPDNQIGGFLGASGSATNVGRKIDLSDFSVLRWDNKANLPKLDESKMRKESGGLFGEFSRGFSVFFAADFKLKLGLIAVVAFLFTHFIRCAQIVEGRPVNGFAVYLVTAIMLVALYGFAEILSEAGKVILKAESEYKDHVTDIHYLLKEKSIPGSKHFRPVTQRYIVPYEEVLSGKLTTNPFFRGVGHLIFIGYVGIVLLITGSFYKQIYIGAVYRFTKSRHKDGFAGVRKIPENVLTGSVSIFDGIFISPFRRIYSRVHASKANAVADELKVRQEEVVKDTEVADLEYEVKVQQAKLQATRIALLRKQEELYDEEKRLKNN